MDIILSAKVVPQAVFVARRIAPQFAPRNESSILSYLVLVLLTESGFTKTQQNKRLKNYTRYTTCSKYIPGVQIIQM